MYLLLCIDELSQHYTNKYKNLELTNQFQEGGKK